MQRLSGERLYSATDLVAFLECEHLSALDLRALDDEVLRAERSQADESKRLIADKGDEHEKRHLAEQRAQGRQVVDIAKDGGSIAEKVQATLAAMREGVEVIFQATLRDGCWVGHADFLRRVDGVASSLGTWSYEVADTKLARSPKAKFLVQLAFYSDLVAKAQGVAPRQMHVVLGDGTERKFRVADFAHYLETLRARFLAAVEGLLGSTRQAPYPVPCDHCDLCHWSERCAKQRVADDHLSQVAGITRIQTARLEEVGVPTMAALAALPVDSRVARIQPETLAKLRGQASLQDQARQTGERKLEHLPLDLDGRRGFHRLPQPDEGDLYFDMEGDPLEDGGLEYLFGLWFRNGGQWTFKPFWAHDRVQERQAFEEFMDFCVVHRRKHPGVHVYHYASYEETALKRLASLHATREVEVDDWLRQGVLVDLYKVVREGLRVSESSYSIKYIERFYRPARAGDVTNAGASIVFYERWRETQEAQLLQDIADYNRDDVESTQQLHDWLLSLRPAGLPWRDLRANADEGEQKSDAVREIEERLEAYRRKLVAPLPPDRRAWSAHDHARELTWQLLDFHRRAAKPAWWAVYSRMDMDEDALFDDPECLADLVLDTAEPPQRVKQSIQYTYVAPEQETKLATGDACRRCDTAEPIGMIEFDEVTRRVRFKLGVKRAWVDVPQRLSIGPGGPIDSSKVVRALFAFADGMVGGGGAHHAVEQFLRRDPPRLAGRAAQVPIVDASSDIVAGCVAAVRALDRSYLYVQGPPGAGKTYSGSHMIAALLADGRRVGVMSNSHKAINHLMTGVLDEAVRQRVRVHAMKKSSRGSAESQLDHIGGVSVSVENENDSEDVWCSGANLVGGTVWFLADRPDDVEPLDFLFVDEAGQVATANLVAAGTNARNIVLLGDQMQLGQPIQGVHPGRSGESALDYLLDGVATIAPDRGIFLATSWRMHPAVCLFISDAVYDGLLQPEANNARRTLLLEAHAHPLLRSAGIVHAAIEHQGCSQRSETEAELVKAVYASALQQRYTDKDGSEHALTARNILVVAPYNVQVNLLKRVLPEGARVGTVDKFQGQEAEMVIVSMTTSSEADLPRHIEFLYSKNRLNVAVSRAKCLAIVIANPALMAIKCSTPKQMALVNTLCWVAEAGRVH
jgi:predicted RecB family nuclease